MVQPSRRSTVTVNGVPETAVTALSGNLSFRNATYNAWIPLLTCAAIYLILTVGLTKLFGRLEKRMAKSDRS